MGNQTQTNIQQPKKRLVSKTFIMVFCVIILLPVGLVGGFGLQCKVRQNMHKSSMSNIIKEYNELKLTKTSSAVTKNVQTGGDCFDSNPWIRATQIYQVNTSGAELVSEFKNNMKSQGYKVINEQYYFSKTCGYSYFANAGNGPINISFSAANYALTGGCNSDDKYQFKDSLYFFKSNPTNVYSHLLNQ